MSSRVLSPGAARLLVALAGLSACDRGDRLPYYEGTPPAVTGLSGSAAEPGNLGGREVVITGSGFGSDPAQVVVQFGSINAEITSVSDTELRVVSPRGPIEGGAVDVLVGTASGQAALEDAYTYEVDPVYDGQTGYILVNNYWHSCYGGGDDLGAGCSEVTYLGTAGTTGSAEFFDFAFPRVHAPSYGWSGGADVSPGEWSVETPAYLPYVSAIEDLRQVVPDFSLYNANLEGVDPWCSDLGSLGGWTFPGDGEYDAFTVSTGSIMSQADCESDPNARAYDLDTLSFCEVEEYQQPHSGLYEAEWPVGRPFFIAQGEGDPSNPLSAVSQCRDGLDNDDDGLVDGQDDECHPVIELLSEGMGLNKLDLTLPEPVRFQVTEGVTPTGYEDVWAVFQGFETCFDDDGDGNDDDDEVALRIEWEPTGLTPTSDGRVKAASTHVRISLSIISLGWFGGDSRPFRATITVPDDWNYDEDTGRSVVEIPVGVMRQIPDVTFNYGSCEENPITGQETCTAGDPLDVGYGYLILTADRVTEYRIQNTDADPAVVFAYTTGDFAFLGWDNPLNKGDCDNCLDDDGDGWPEALDADCIEGGAEDGAFDGTADFTCSDGQDNDGDGDVDVEDADCESGVDRESNCGDGEDNDGDGWTDDEDGECQDINGQEFGADDPSWTCTNGLDDDGDGWIDAADPACGVGSDLEEDGFGATACNDGVDNDGHQDPDAQDPLCASKGAEYEAEEPVYVEECVDGLDNESRPDGYVDGFDPDCEYSPYWKEGSNSHDVDSKPFTKQCYDGEDNDGDGLEDAEDPGCWNELAGYVPDGFLDNEANDGDCVDGVDNDLDGLTDLEDPGCAPGVGRSEDSAP